MLRPANAGRRGEEIMGSIDQIRGGQPDNAEAVDRAAALDASPPAPPAEPAAEDGAPGATRTLRPSSTGLNAGLLQASLSGNVAHAGLVTATAPGDARKKDFAALPEADRKLLEELSTLSGHALRERLRGVDLEDLKRIQKALDKPVSGVMPIGDKEFNRIGGLIGELREAVTVKARAVNA